MENLKRFTTQYKAMEDRFLLIGEDGQGETVSLWLTQRLLLKTVPVMVDWLQKNNPVDLKTSENSAQAQEMAQVFNQQPVQPKAAAATAQKTDKNTASEPDAQSGEPALVQSVDLNLNPKLLRLCLRQGDQELANLALNGNQLRQWLAVVNVLWKNAGWPTHIWPRWLSEDTRLVANQTEGAFH